MGLSTPYVELLPLPPPPDPDFPYFPMPHEDAMFIDGVRVPCTLDGMTIGCSTAMNMLDTGSAIPAALAHLQIRPGFQFTSHGLGIFTATWNTYTSGHWTDTYVRVVGGGDSGTTTGTGPVWHPGFWTQHSASFSYSWSTGSQAPRRQQTGLSPQSPGQATLASTALSDLKTMLKVREFSDKRLVEEGPSDSCQTMVLDKLATIGFNVKDFLDYLSQGANFYNGPTSTATIATVAPNQVLRGGQPLPSNYTVANLFAEPSLRGLNALTSSSLSQTTLTVFSGATSLQADSNYNRALVFHEALHGYGSYLSGGTFGKFGDNELKALFGLTGGGSSQITKYIQDHCGDKSPDPH